MALERAEILIGCYRRDDAADPEIYGRAVVAVLMRYPESVVLEVTEPATGLPSRLKWLPAIAEIVEACDGGFAPIARQIAREKALADHARGLPPPSSFARTPAQQAEIDGQVETERRNLGIPEGGYGRGGKPGFQPLGKVAKQVLIGGEHG